MKHKLIPVEMIDDLNELYRKAESLYNAGDRSQIVIMVLNTTGDILDEVE